MIHLYARLSPLFSRCALHGAAARTAFGVCLLLGMGCAVGLGQTPAALDLKPIPVSEPRRGEAVSYSRQIAELLENKCTGCHGSVLAEKRLSLESVAGMLKGGKSGPAIVRGKADESLMFKMAAHRALPVMPPRDKPANMPMSPLELGLLKVWIDSGAKDDSGDDGQPTNDAAQAIGLDDPPPGVQPINAVDMTLDGQKVAAGRANVVQVYDVDSGLEIVSLGGHKDLIQSLRYSPDGTLLAAGSYQIVTLWTVPTGSLRKSLSGHDGPILSMAVAPDGRTAVSGGRDRTIRVWNLAEGKLLRTLAAPVPVTALAIIANGRSLIYGGGDGTIRWLDSGHGRERLLMKGHTGAVLDLAVLSDSPGAMRIVSAAEDGTARIWTIHHPFDTPAGGKTAKVPVESPPLVLSGHKGPVRALGITPDGRTIVTGGDDATVTFWGASDGKTQGAPLASGHAGAILAVAISPDGKLLLTGSADKTARVIARNDGKVIRTLAHHNAPVRSVAFSPAGDRLATADERGGLKVWETATGQGVIAFGHVAPGGSPIQPIQKVSFSGIGSLVSASADGTLKTWNFSGEWTAHKTLGTHVFRVLALDFSPDGRLLAAGGGQPSRSGEVKIWEVGKGLLGRSWPSLHSDTVFSLRFSPDGTKLASASADKFLKVTNVADGKVLRSYEGHTHHVLAVDWKSNGNELVTGGADNVLKVWDFGTGEQVRTLRAAGKQVTSVRWIAGKPEVVGASGDTQVRIWNPENGVIPRRFAGASDYVYGVAASADGSRIASGGADSVLFIWNGQSAQVIQKLEPRANKPAGAR
jgi:WD40 repeat protein